MEVGENPDDEDRSSTTGTECTSEAGDAVLPSQFLQDRIDAALGQQCEDIELLRTLLQQAERASHRHPSVDLLAHKLATYQSVTTGQLTLSREIVITDESNTSSPQTMPLSASDVSRLTVVATPLPTPEHERRQHTSTVAAIRAKLEAQQGAPKLEGHRSGILPSPSKDVDRSAKVTAFPAGTKSPRVAVLSAQIEAAEAAAAATAAKDTTPSRAKMTKEERTKSMRLKFVKLRQQASEEAEEAETTAQTLLVKSTSFAEPRDERNLMAEQNVKDGYNGSSEMNHDAQPHPGLTMADTDQDNILVVRAGGCQRSTDIDTTL
eukprot:SAG31_NODE_1945_length_6853_cov_4.546491_1_plen_320_part_10